MVCLPGPPGSDPSLQVPGLVGMWVERRLPPRQASACVHSKVWEAFAGSAHTKAATRRPEGGAW